jgi:hypothetical protein
MTRNVFLWAGCLAACWFPLPVSSETIVVDVGTREARAMLGFGWSRPERDAERTFTWIKRQEADVWFELEKPTSDYKLHVVAAPLYIHYLQQNIGVYLNDEFVAEWICEQDPAFQDFSTVVPVQYFKEGRNRLILRVGYRRKVPGDKRELGLAVDRITLAPVDGD